MLYVHVQCNHVYSVLRSRDTFGIDIILLPRCLVFPWTYQIEFIINPLFPILLGYLLHVFILVEPIFEVEDRIRATNIKFSLEYCGWVGQNTFTSQNFYQRLYHKNVSKQTFLSMVNSICQHILDLGIHTNVTRIVFVHIFLK